MSLTEDLVEEFREAFELFDKDGLGSISVEDVGVFMKALGRRLSSDELKAMTEGEVDSVGRIQFPQFIKLVAAKLQETDSIEDMREAFLVFDRDKSGSISGSELKHVMHSLGEQVTTEEVEEMIKEVSPDGNGELSFEDFLQFIQQKGLTGAHM
mmetsp:Transcript_86472/g.201200  ORF Transcript_86472/g.201200 Transcript_86472/m.201200 type:complete len:154 (+) Transcript_86472:56-517(+)|eukprot:CAMPEP_0171078700 /NCGR_PEP_ID=MMETSP0766_2-20121228/14796_1 /TAXON_ID=439317 /ORGANISM="Gambierdiscus australes, Strain CAWD 149" /LENGTH=153 /DNA_ID=CAMNT_0011535845 /DNA_START=45 /DNA_END=506 /DNA_ORIENTATION=-